MPGVSCDGLDPEMMYQTMAAAVARARAGDDPTLVEAHTYRLQGHIFGADYSYIPMEELNAAQERASKMRLRQRISVRQVTDSNLEQIEPEVGAEIDASVT